MKKRALYFLFAACFGLVLTLGGLFLAQTGRAAPTGVGDYFFREWEFADNSPFAYTRIDAEYSLETGNIYILGGRLGSGDTDGRVWEFNPATGVYTDTGVDMPTPVSNYQIARLTDGGGDEVFVTFGGRPQSGGTVNVVQGFYPGTFATVTFAADPLPIATAPGGVAVVGNIAYAFGGFDGAAMVDDTYIFDITAADGARWTTGPDLNLARSYLSTAVVDNVIYAIGGDTFDGAALLPQTIVEKLDTTALGVSGLAWDDVGVADLPLGCDEMPSFGFSPSSNVELAGAIVTAGCGQWPDEIVESLLYDIGSDAWTVDFNDINQVRRNHAGVFVPNGDGTGGMPGMWIFGGINEADSNVHVEVEVYQLEMLGDFNLVSAVGELVGFPGGNDNEVAAFNNSGGNDTFDLAYNSVKGWAVSGPATVVVNDGEWESITVSTDIPSAVACDDPDTVTVTGTGQGDPGLTDMAVFQVRRSCEGTVGGIVMDANTEATIPYAYLFLEDPNDPEFFVETFADANGDYIFTGVASGTYTITYSAEGYPFVYPSPYTVDIVTGDLTVFDVVMDAPVMAWSHDSITMTVQNGGVATMTLTIGNEGTSDLHFTLGSYVEDVLPPPPSSPSKNPFGISKIDPRILSETAVSSDGTTDYIIMMREAADLRAAYAIEDWDARGSYVYNALVTHAERTQAGVKAILTGEGVSYKSFFSSNAVLVRGDLRLAYLLAARPDVDYLLANDEVQLENPNLGLVPYGPAEAPNTTEWGVDRVNAPDVWSTYGISGTGVVVANVDTGVEWTHSALVNQYRGGPGDHDYNWYMPTSGCAGETEPCDNDGHGSHTMGTMVGDDGGTNQIGVAPGAEWIACKGCEANGCSFEALLSCGDWIAAPTDLTGANPDPSERPHIVNNSWGGGGGDFWYGNVVGAWRAAGIFPQFSGGNSGPACETSGAPGDYDISFSAAATDISDNIAGFSSRGPAAVTGLLKPNISGPGVNIRSSVPGNSYANFNGTSMASPHVAGVTALLWSADPSLVGDIENTMWLLSQTADPLFTTDVCGGDTPMTHPNHTFGYGMVDALNAISTTMSGDISVPWLTIDPMGGTINPDGSMEITLVFDTNAVLIEGDQFTGVIQMTANEPYNPDIRIPVTMQIVGGNVYLPLMNTGPPE